LHRQQVGTQIVLPIVLAALLFLVASAILWQSAFHPADDVDRWAAISTMWLVLPVMIVGLIVLLLLGAMIFLLARLAGVIPPYSYKAQQVADRVARGAQRVTEITRKPVLALRGLGDLWKRRIGRPRGRK
jgi:Na+/proline symporter